MLAKKVYIQGYGQTKFGEHYEKSILDLTIEAIDAALQNANLKPSDLDALILSSMLCGELAIQSQLQAAITAYYGLHIPAIRVEAACASGGIALWNAMQLIQSGNLKTILIVGAEKMTDHDNLEVSKSLMQAASPEEQASGVSFPGLYALMAKAYFEKYSITSSELAIAPVLMHKQAAKNPYAQFRNQISIDEVLTSPNVAEPLRLLDCSPISDGAAAIILSSNQNVSKLEFVASSLATDTPNLAKRSILTEIPATQIAMQNLVKLTNIKTTDISVIELHDCFSIALFIALEDLGFAQPGKAYQFLSDASNKLTINPSGGLKACGHPVGATGIKQIIEVCRWLKEENQQFGLTHNVGGTGGTSVVSLIKNLNV